MQNELGITVTILKCMGARQNFISILQVRILFMVQDMIIDFMQNTSSTCFVHYSIKYFNCQKVRLPFLLVNWWLMLLDLVLGIKNNENM